jgi:hypothetical protein
MMPGEQFLGNDDCAQQWEGRKCEPNARPGEILRQVSTYFGPKSGAGLHNEGD